MLFLVELWDVFGLVCGDFDDIVKWIVCVLEVIDIVVDVVIEVYVDMFVVYYFFLM